MTTVAFDEPHPTSALPPGPRTPALWQTLRWVRSPYAALDASRRRWGDRYTVAALGSPGRMVVFTDPDAIKDIFTAPGDVLCSGMATAPLLAPLVGLRSVIVLDGDRHLRERRFMGPQLHGERMHVYGRVMREVADRVIDRWPVGRPFPIHREMQTITIDVIARAVFGVDDEAVLTRFRAAVERFMAPANGPAAPFIALPFFQIDLGRFSPWGRFVRDRQVIRDILLTQIRRARREGLRGRTDILSMLAAARDDRGEQMTEDELLDETFTLLMAGHETTATTLAWAFWHLLRHPAVVAELRAELGRVTGGEALEARHMAQLVFLDAVIKESMRLTPVATHIARYVNRPVRIGGVDLTAGTTVAAAIYLTHRDPRLWEEPERFAPRRFLDTRQSPYTFFPFGGGIRRCLGAAFAAYEMKIVLAEVLSRVDLGAVDGYRMRPVVRAVTIAPSRGMPVVVERPLPARSA